MMDNKKNKKLAQVFLSKKGINVLKTQLYCHCEERSSLRIKNNGVVRFDNF